MLIIGSLVITFDEVMVRLYKISMAKTGSTTRVHKRAQNWLNF